MTSPVVTLEAGKAVIRVVVGSSFGSRNDMFDSWLKPLVSDNHRSIAIYASAFLFLPHFNCYLGSESDLGSCLSHRLYIKTDFEDNREPCKLCLCQNIYLPLGVLNWEK